MPELKGLAFTITGIEAVDVLQRSRDIIAGLPAGRTWETVKEELVQEMLPYLGGESRWRSGMPQSVRRSAVRSCSCDCMGSGPMKSRIPA